MKRIAIFQSDLNVGGIQKSLLNFLASLDYTQYQVDLFLFHEGNFFGSQLPGGVRVHYLHSGGKLLNLMPFALAKKLIRFNFPDEPVYDAALDYNSYQLACALGAVLIPAKKRVMWIHNDVEIKCKNEWKYRLMWMFFKDKLRYFGEFAAVSAGLIAPFRKMSGIPDKKINVISNHIDTAEIFEKAAQEPEGFSPDPGCFNIVAVGRLCHQKAYDIMLTTFKKVHDARPDVRLYIIGDGPDREKLRRLRGELGLESAVTFLGNQKNPFGYMALMDAFLITSRYEGQGMVIWEAKALGLPVFMTRNLEKYNETIEGQDDVAAALIAAKRTRKIPNDLQAYNDLISARTREMLS